MLGDGARSSDELAEAAEADPDALYRLLRALASAGVFEELEGRRFALTPVGEHLRGDHPRSLQGWAAFLGRPYYWEVWGNLLHSIRTGDNAFQHLHGKNVWDFRQEHPDESDIFDRAMASLTRATTEAVLSACDFGRFAIVVDVGGGNGALLTALLQSYPAMRGVLFDHPAVVSAAEKGLDDAGVADRCRTVGGSFFEFVPEGADAYILKSIIHDWEDEESSRILRVCRAAMSAESALLLVEWDLGPPNAAPIPKFGDLNMLVAPGGRERTRDEYAALLEAAGLRLDSATPTGTGLLILESVPV